MHRVFIASLLVLGACASASAQTHDGYYGPGYPGQPGYSGQHGYPGPQGYPQPSYPQPHYGGPGHRGAPGFPGINPYSPRGMRMPGPAGMPPMAQEPLTADSLEAARRLYAVADTVLLRGAALCEGRTKPQLGLRAWSRDNEAFNAAYTTRGADHGVRVFALARGGPAELAGLRIGDRILSINGETIPAQPGAMSVYAARLEAALARGAVTIGYEREGQQSAVRVTPAPACDIRIVFTNSPMVNAATDGRSVIVMRGLVNLLRRDDELALVVGHELAHNALGHFTRGRALGHDRAFDGGDRRTQASMREFEREADYVGLYFVALAGYDYQAAIESSNRMSSANPFGDRSTSTHPSQAERYQLLVKAAREIRAKLAQGSPLRPNIPTGRAALMRPAGVN